MKTLMNHHGIDCDHTTMEWGIKESFRRYFERLPDHRYDLQDGARRCSDGQIEFQVDPHTASADTLAFRGAVQLTAHHGALSVRIADPRITLRDATEAELSAEVDSVDGQPVRMVIALLTAGRSDPDTPSRRVFQAEVAEEGQFLFMGNYFAGDPMDPVTVWFSTA